MLGVRFGIFIIQAIYILPVVYFLFIFIYFYDVLVGLKNANKTT